MSPTASSRRGRAAPVLALLSAFVLSASCLLAVVLAPAHATAPREPHRWTGFAIPSDGHAAGGWIGGYRVGDTLLFLTTPTRHPNRAGYRSPRLVGDLPGRRTSRRETARAAWILSKFGAYRDAIQAAAVDASVYDLLVGGSWQIDGRRGARRIRQSGDRASVARFARIMMRQSRSSAGAYVATLTASSADVGGTVAVTLSVRDGHGEPAGGLPVTLAMAGHEPVASVTGDDGRAVARFTADDRGWQGVTATVRQVPDHRLHLWSPEKKRQASAAEGGARRTLVVETSAAVRGQQSLTLAASPATATVGSPTRVLGTVAGDGASRSGSASLHGPFASAASAQCSGAPVATVTTSVAADGQYAWPPVTPSAGGYYLWRVALDGTDTSLPVSACGAATKVMGRSALGLSAPTDAAAFDVVSAQVTLAGLPSGGPVDVTTSLYGPYDTTAVACAGNHRDVVQRRPGNGAFASLSFQVDQPGWYVWRASVPEGELWLGSSSACGGAGTVTHVQ